MGSMALRPFPQFIRQSDQMVGAGHAGGVGSGSETPTPAGVWRQTVAGNAFARRRSGHGRKSRSEKSTDRTDSVHAHYRESPSRTDPDHSCLDHEVLRTGSVTA